MIAVPPTPARMIAVTNGANSRIDASTKKPPRRSSAPNRTRKLPACKPGRAVAERDRRDRQREPAQPQREQELLHELRAVRIRRADGRHDRLARQDHHVADLLEQVLGRQECPVGYCSDHSAPPSFSSALQGYSPGREHYAMGVPEGQGATVVCSATGAVVCSARFGAEETAPRDRCGVCAGRTGCLRRWRAPGRGRARGRLPRRGRPRRSPPKQKLAKSSKLVITVAERGDRQDDPERRRDRERASTRSSTTPRSPTPTGPSS